MVLVGMGSGMHWRKGDRDHEKAESQGKAYEKHYLVKS